jgi:hypothetical protein
MTIENAIKKLQKNGFKVTEDSNSGVYNRDFKAVNPQHRKYLQISSQDGEVCLIDLRTPGYEDDSMTDYHAGTFCDNISQAILLATNQ